MALVSSRRRMKAVGILLAASFAFCSLTSCQLAKNQFTYDRSAEKDRQAYRDALAPMPPMKPDEVADVPDFKPVLSTPQELRLPTPLVTVSVNRTVSLHDLFVELTQQAGVDLELDPQIHGSIIFSAKDRPFDEVINRICDMAGLRYTFKDNVLRVQLDRPFVKNYSVDYINAMRKSSSSIKTDISLSSASGDSTGGGGGSGGGGSSSSIDTKIEGDLWKELSQNIQQILTSSDTYTSLATTSDPVAMPINPTPPPPLPADGSASTTPPALPGSVAAAPMAAAVAPTLQISTPPSQPVIPNAPATFSISKETGILSVFASQRQQRQVASFLQEFRKRAGTQIMIEAKVLEVDLSDEFATGIDWNDLHLGGIVKNLTLSAPQPAFATAPSATFSGVLNTGNDFSTLVQAISRFGTVRALSSPRVTVLNNQPAIVNIAQNNIYFNFDVTVEPGQNNNPPTIGIKSKTQSVPEGVLLTVLPIANPDTGEIQLVVRPTVSKITGYVTDPTIALTLATTGANLGSLTIPDNKIPEVSLQEIDSTIKMQSGQMMVMGGLMKDSNTVTDTGIPVLGDLPYVGYMFKNHSDSVQKSELIIFLRAVIVPGGNAEAEDKKIYNQFSEDRRPGNL